MDSDNTWTSVGKGGRAISFPPEAAAAFSSKSRRPIPSASGKPPRAEFPTDAAAAFGRKGRITAAPVAPTSAFDADAAAAFGGGRREERHVDRRETGAHHTFDAAAAAAFGGKERRGKRDDEFPDVFGKKKSAFAAAAEMGIGDDGDAGYTMSAFARKRAEAAARPPEPKKQTFEEMFPALGGPAKAAAAPAPAAVTKAPGKPTLAEMMRKRVEEEDAESARKAALERDRMLAARAEESERARLRGLRGSRMTNFISYAGDADDEEYDDIGAGAGDLDYDAYGVKRKELTGPERPEEASDSSSEDDAEGAEDTMY